MAKIKQAQRTTDPTVEESVVRLVARPVLGTLEDLRNVGSSKSWPAGSEEIVYALATLRAFDAVEHVDNVYSDSIARIVNGFRLQVFAQIERVIERDVECLLFAGPVHSAGSIYPDFDDSEKALKYGEDFERRVTVLMHKLESANTEEFNVAVCALSTVVSRLLYGAVRALETKK